MRSPTVEWLNSCQKLKAINVPSHHEHFVISFSPFPSSGAIALFKKPFKKNLWCHQLHSFWGWPIFHCHKQEKVFFIIFILNMHLCCNLNILFFFYQSWTWGRDCSLFVHVFYSYLKSVIIAVGRWKLYQNIQESFFVFMHKIRTRLMTYIVFSIAILLLRKPLKISETTEESSRPSLDTRLMN